ncbi:hypothetical protein ACFJIW_12355 [Tahibacter sp. UC22_41]|uniref:hypothetical protein n=1 Tax=Tahibacter sp. UC22_41 TaxID=3350178 RepID=UPI0036D774A5
MGISLLMGGFTCLLASWSIGRPIQLRWPDGIGVAVALAALFAAWFCIDGVYVLYHAPAGNRMDREGNFRRFAAVFHSSRESGASGQVGSRSWAPEPP